MGLSGLEFILHVLTLSMLCGSSLRDATSLSRMASALAPAFSMVRSILRRLRAALVLNSGAGNACTLLATP